MSVRSRVSSVHWLGTILEVLGGILGLSLFTILWWAAARGFDWSDEGYYLNAITDPDAEVGTARWFGAFYHWLYIGVIENLVALRRVTLLITWGLGLAVATRLQQRRDLVGNTAGGWRRAVQVVAWSSPVLAVHLLLPGTPSYNTLHLQGLLIAVLGLLHATDPASRRPVLGWVTVGVGGALAAMAKPPAAALLAIFVIAFCARCWRQWWRSCLVGGGSALATIALVAGSVGVSPTSFLHRVRSGIRLATELGAHPALIRWDPFPLTGWNRVVAALLALSTLLITAFLIGRPQRSARWTSLGIAALGSAAGSLHLWHVASPASGGSVLDGLSILTFAALTMALATVIWAGTQGWRDRTNAMPSERLAWSLLLLALPVAYAFSSNNNLWMFMSRAVIFWLFAIIVATANDHPSIGRRDMGAASALFITALVCTLAVAMLIAPYRTAPLADATKQVEIGASHSKILVDPETAGAVRAINELSSTFGISRGTDILDLTGGSPGVIWALGARAAGQAWIAGSYPGSNAAATIVLRELGCEAMKDVWVLWSPDHPRRLDPGILQEVGRTLSDYEFMGKLTYPSYSWGNHLVGRYDVHLLKPQIDMGHCP